MPYTLTLKDTLNLITEALHETYRANAAEPYDHAAYEAASGIVMAGLNILTGNPEVSREIREHLYDWSGESVGAWFIANYMTEVGLKTLGPNHWTVPEFKGEVPFKARKGA